MEIKISTFISDQITLNEEEAQLVDQLIPIKHYPKGTVLLREGQISRNSYFLIQGLIRSYHLSNGKDCTNDFYLEDSAICVMDSYLNQSPSRFYLECLEDITVAELSYEKEKELYKRIPAMESICRVGIENEYAEQQRKISELLTLKPEERYLDIMHNKPELLHRVSGLHLSSFLGIQPESLSRLRKRVAQNKKL